jgi:hypothetical protein
MTEREEALEEAAKVVDSWRESAAFQLNGNEREYVTRWLRNAVRDIRALASSPPPKGGDEDNSVAAGAAPLPLAEHHRLDGEVLMRGPNLLAAARRAHTLLVNLEVDAGEYYRETKWLADSIAAHSRGNEGNDQ